MEQKKSWLAPLAVVVAGALALVFLGLYARAKQLASDQDGALRKLNEEKEAQRLQIARAEDQLAQRQKELDRKAETLKKTLEDLLARQQEIDRLQADVARMRKACDLGAEIFALKGTDLAKDAVGRVFCRDKDLLFLTAHLPPPAPGKAYQLWAIVADQKDPVPAGVYDEKGNLTKEHWKLAAGAKITGFEVTLEEGPADKPAQIWMK